jgi:radical SAM superfamily enzyme YgiQ (UPF0313 family)
MLYHPAAMRQPPHLAPDMATPPPTPHSLLLVAPFYVKDPHASFGKHVLTPCLALTTLAAATPAHWAVRFWDENLLQGPPPADPFPQVVGITVHLTFAQRAFELADWFRARGARVILGGLHISACPEECHPHADALVIGEGSSIWPELLTDIEAGRLQSHYTGTWHTPYREQPQPRRTLLPSWAFLTPASVIATRGCHNHCDFCYLSTAGQYAPPQALDVEQLTRQIADSGQPYAVFLDNNLGSQRGYLRKLCAALRPLQVIWSAAISIDAVEDPSVVRAMALAGCTGVFIGFESLGEANLSAAGKRSPGADEFARRIRLLHAHGIQVNGSFVFGFDGDRLDVFARTLDWIERQRLECATLHILTPYPGTPLFQRMQREGRILHQDWARYDTAHCVFRPVHMSPEQLEAGYAWAYRELFSLRSIWARRPEQAAAVLPYLTMSILYKKMNRLWPLLIRHRLTHTAWQPLVELSRRRHLRFRRRLGQCIAAPAPSQAPDQLAPLPTIPPAG